MSAEKRVLNRNCYIEDTKDGLCAVGFHDLYEPNLIIPDGVIWISNDAFNRYYGLETVAFPDTVDYIGSHAFYNCSSLRTIFLGKNIKTILSGAFSGCHQLTEADFSQTAIETLPDSLFNGCKKLHTIKLPKTLKKINSFALSGAENCVVLELQEGLKVIEDMNLECMNKLSIINLPSTVIHIPDLHYKDNIKTIVLSKEQHERFAEYLPEKAKIIYKD